MKTSSIAGMQRRETNRKHKLPFAIQPGFEAPLPTSCQYVLEDKQGRTCLCEKKVLNGFSYCKRHYKLCTAKKGRSEQEDDAAAARLAEQDFKKDSSQDALALVSNRLFLP